VDLAILEKFAVLSTGRRSVVLRKEGRTRLVVYPDSLAYTEILTESQADAPTKSYYLKYTVGLRQPFRVIGDFLLFVSRLLRVSGVSGRIDLYTFSDVGDWVYVFAAVVTAGILGIAVYFHDFQFRTERHQRLRRLVYSICRRIIVGDMPTAEQGMETPPLACRADATDLTVFRDLRKNRAVPRVLVYGDFDDHKVLSLVKRSHEMVKSKYPRTEFVLMSLVHRPYGIEANGLSDGSIIPAIAHTDDELLALFREGDVLILLSVGGLNQCLIRRARAAGYPIIANGIDYSSAGMPPLSIIMVPRDSYGGLADAVIRLVDDEEYYRRFGSD
jgi:hypothetical protein